LDPVLRSRAERSACTITKLPSGGSAWYVRSRDGTTCRSKRYHRLWKRREGASSTEGNLGQQEGSSRMLHARTLHNYVHTMLRARLASAASFRQGKRHVPADSDACISPMPVIFSPASGYKIAMISVSDIEKMSCLRHTSRVWSEGYAVQSQSVSRLHLRSSGSCSPSGVRASKHAAILQDDRITF
jgi:hypothetical protein